MSPDEALTGCTCGAKPQGDLVVHESHCARTVRALAKLWPITDPPQAVKVAESAATQPTPEGISAAAMVADAMDGELRRQIADLQATIKHERQQHAEVAEKHAAEYHRIATALGCHVHDDLAAKAAQSRGAAVPPADSAIAEGPAG